MGVEIERKFLVQADWKQQALDAGSKIVDVFKIRQGYLSVTPTVTTRVRVNDTHKYAVITIKGKRNGISCPEYEYIIPYNDGVELIAMCSSILEKIRHEVVDALNQLWEVDVFTAGVNTGLQMAEIELESAEQLVRLPFWVTVDVSEDVRYTNAKLVSDIAPHQ